MNVRRSLSETWEEKWNFLGFCPTLINSAIRKSKNLLWKHQRQRKNSWPSLIAQQTGFCVWKKINACTMQFGKLPLKNLSLTSDLKFVCEQLKLAASSEDKNFSRSFMVIWIFTTTCAKSFSKLKNNCEIFKIFRLLTLVRLLACCGIYCVTFTSSRLTKFRSEGNSFWHDKH